MNVQRRYAPTSGQFDPESVARFARIRILQKIIIEKHILTRWRRKKRIWKLSLSME